MPIVVNLDQRASRGKEDLIATEAAVLNQALRADLRLPFVRTAGDEMQTLLASGTALAYIASHALDGRDKRWWIGVGLGDVDKLGDTSRESQGSAYWHAREASETAKNPHRSPWGVAVVGDPRDAADDLMAALNALAVLLARRTDRQREAVRLANQGASGTSVGKELGITPQSANELLRASGIEEQRQLERLIGRLAQDVV